MQACPIETKKCHMENCIGKIHCTATVVKNDNLSQIKEQNSKIGNYLNKIVPTPIPDNDKESILLLCKEHFKEFNKLSKDRNSYLTNDE
jgi:uncharacterized protein YsxB (DUF464 family)